MTERSQLEQELEIKQVARGIYRWIRWLSLISVPWFIFRVFDLYNEGAFELFLAAAVPGIPFYLVLLMYNASPYPFVLGHARQAMILVGLRVLSAFIALLLLYEYEFFGLLFFLISNGSLWHFGSRWGAMQVEAGECWWISRSGAAGRQVLSRRSLRELEDAIRGMKNQGIQKPSVQDAAAARAPEPLVVPDDKNAVEKAEALLLAYRIADPEERQHILREMEALGLVEEF